MKLKKAIEIGEDNIKAKPPGVNHDYFDALKLLVQAGKRIQGQRSQYLEISSRPLPGETDE